MSVTKLDTPYLDGGIRSTNYFNGRILSREDMQRDRDAARAIQARLGHAAGAGIVSGFEVVAKSIGGSSISDPVLTVRAGLAVNREGCTLALDRDVDVSLIKPVKPVNAGTPLAGSFATCAPPESGVYVVGTGVYLLSVGPAQAKQGLAVVSGLGNGTASCNVKEIVEGVQFRLSEMKLTGAEKADDAHLRNVAAYKVFLAEITAAASVRDPYGVPPAAPAALVDPPLDDCEVPLALFQWTNTGGTRWVDLWSVRRRLALGPDTDALGFMPDMRQRALGEAMVRQFQQHVGGLRDGGNLPARAGDLFRWLPPVGLVPLGGKLGGKLGASGVDYTLFFSGFTTRGPMFIEGARVPPFVEQAGRYPPIRVGDPELVWLYLVRENRMPVNGVVPAQPYLIFALGRLPCQVVPRFDVSYWDYANYALDDELTSL